MAEKIEWLSDLHGALERAQKENKLVLLEFFNPE